MRQLYNHQKKILDDLREKNKIALYLDMGLGKTVTSSMKAVSYQVPILVVCMKSLVSQWIYHFGEWHSDYQIYDLSKSKQLNTFLEDTNTLKVGIITYGLQWRRKELQKLKGFTLILDESQNICNPTSKQTKGIFKLKFDNLILASGTPCGGAYEKLYTQYKLLGGTLTKQQYESRYCNMFDMEVGGVRFKVLSKTNPYKNIDELKQWFRDNGAVFMKSEEVLSLPEQSFIDIKCDNTKYYREFVRDGYTEVDGNDLLNDTSLNDMLNRRYLAGVFNTNKQKALSEVFNSTDKKIIVFYNFTSELEKIKLCLTHRQLFIVNGDVRQQDDFKNCTEPCILAVQYQAGSTGLNLQFCDTIVYYSPPLQSNLYEQSKKRIHRIGQDKPCFYYRLITSKSIDEDIYRSLEEKQDYTEELFKNARA